MYACLHVGGTGRPSISFREALNFLIASAASVTSRRSESSSGNSTSIMRARKRNNWSIVGVSHALIAFACLGVTLLTFMPPTVSFGVRSGQAP
jgi:hypothetical protein